MLTKKCTFTDTIVSIVPSTTNVEQGETFTVSVYVEPGEPIIGVSFDYLYFNPNLVHANSVTEGDLFYSHTTFFNPGTIDNVNGEIRDVYELIIGLGNVTDPGYFVNIEFTAQLINGTSALDLEGVIVANEAGVEVPLIVNDGLVIIGGGEPNYPPYEPSDPDPYDGETGVDIDADLSWTGGDPDSGDTVTYDIYFGTTSPPPQVVTGQSETTYDPRTMNPNTQYFWQIVSWDNHGASTEGPIWDFTTEEEPEPDLDCDGDLDWKDVEPGSTVTGEFTVENIGDPESLLDWEIESYPDWGTWTFDPESGTGLLPGPPVTVDVEVAAPDEPETECTGEVKIVNSNDPSDYCIIQASLITPVSQHSINPQLLQFLQNLMQRFPMMEQILKSSPLFSRILNQK